MAVTAANTADRDVIDELLNEPGADQPATDTDTTTERRLPRPLTDLPPTAVPTRRWLGVERL